MTDTVNPPAFPHEDTMSTGMRPGMTLLDYMAAKAMQAANGECSLENMTH